MGSRLTLEQVALDRSVAQDGRAGWLRVLSGVSCDVPTGGRLAVIGPSGAGKTSLLRLLNRLDDPVEGRVLLDGEDVCRLEVTALRRRVGLVFQQPFLFDLTVEGNLDYPQRLLKRDLPREQAAALLQEFALPEELLSRRGDQLSGGQQQRVAVARALTLGPELLALDEPTAALDEESAHALLDALLRRNAEMGLTLVVVTHAPEILRRLACPVLLVHDGRADVYPDADAALAAVHGKHLRME